MRDSKGKVNVWELVFQEWHCVIYNYHSPIPNFVSMVRCAHVGIDLSENEANDCFWSYLSDERLGNVTLSYAIKCTVLSELVSLEIPFGTT